MSISLLRTRTEGRSIHWLVGRHKEQEWLHEQTFRSRRRPSVLYGPAGIGKTALLYHFCRGNRGFPRRQLWTLPNDPHEALIQLRVATDELKQGRPFTELEEDWDYDFPIALAIDNADALSPVAIKEFTNELLNLKRIEAVVFARRDPIDRELMGVHLELPPLNDEEVLELLRHRLHIDFPAGEMSAVLAAAKGNPGALSLLHQLAEGKGYNEIKQLLSGNLYGQKQALIVPEKKLILAAKPRIITANDLLIEKLKKEPEGLYDLDPRKFEEIVADLMEGMGYDVELTPRSQDGGKDILASMMTEHGRMLCLVEAKRYSAERPVQVGLVRQLYGTLCDANASSAMLVTTSRFTRGATQFQERNQYRLSLKDYGAVVKWISAHGSSRSGLN